MSTEEVIKSYYESQSKKDDQWKELWTDDAVFSDASQTLLAKGKEAVIQSFTPFLKGEKMNQDVAEVSEVKDGKLARLTIYFDLTAYRRFMQG